MWSSRPNAARRVAIKIGGGGGGRNAGANGVGAAGGSGIIIMPTTATGAVFGASMYNIAASAYGFFVTKGIQAVLNGDAALTIGSAVSCSNATAGAVENGVIAQGFIGTAAYTGVDTEYRAVFLNL